MQPLLLLKQTLEESYDPGALLLYGPNVKFTSADQFSPRTSKRGGLQDFQIKLRTGKAKTVATSFRRTPNGPLDIREVNFFEHGERVSIHLGMRHEEILSVLPPLTKAFHEGMLKSVTKGLKWTISRRRCFLEFALSIEGTPEALQFSGSGLSLSADAELHLGRLIHLPGLRGNPERAYPVTAVGPTFPGTFEKYVASVISQWQAKGNSEKLEQLSQDLENLGLTWKVRAKSINDTQVELQVGRLAHAVRGGAQDLVNIADIGLGVSQTLPVLVALRMANPGQLVYLEQPEIHLHPRAQSALAQVLAEAANRGVRVVVETHSNLLLLGVQALVAEGQLASENVKLHWFTRRDDGSTKIASADLDTTGAFGNWPEDFADVALEAESRYLDAAEEAAEASGRKNGYASKEIEASRH